MTNPAISHTVNITAADELMTWRDGQAISSHAMGVLPDT